VVAGEVFDVAVDLRKNSAMRILMIVTDDSGIVTGDSDDRDRLIEARGLSAARIVLDGGLGV